MLFSIFLQRLIHKGTLRLVTKNGRAQTFGDGNAPRVTVKLHRYSLEWSLGLRPDLKIGEAYMEGTLTLEEGTLSDFITVLFINYEEMERTPFFRWCAKLSGQARLLTQFNPLTRARNNVAFHYDLPDEIYDLFLDKDRQYSCGYFTDPRNSLDQAQEDKKRHIASKLLLDRPGLKVLDIGSGWGGLGLYLARDYACDVTGLTLSTNQHEVSRRRAWFARLADCCRFKLCDYRQETGRYDRIVSVGMFEHVGKKNYADFFAQIYRLLDDNGVCLLHNVSRFDDPAPVNAFIRKYIFPGADVPALSEVTRVIEKSGLLMTDIEILRLHYAETLKRWGDAFRLHEADIVRKFGEAFFRRWDFYLTSCEMGFRYQHLMVTQIQLTKRLASVPITRDYMYEAEHRRNEPRARYA